MSFEARRDYEKFRSSFRFFTEKINPASIAANTTAEQTFTGITGLSTNDAVFVNKPTLTAGIGIAGARCSAKNTLAITFINATGGAVDPAEETYTIVAIRRV